MEPAEIVPKMPFVEGKQLWRRHIMKCYGKLFMKLKQNRALRPNLVLFAVAGRKVLKFKRVKGIECRHCVRMGRVMLHGKLLQGQNLLCEAAINCSGIKVFHGIGQYLRSAIFLDNDIVRPSVAEDSGPK